VAGHTQTARWSHEPSFIFSKKAKNDININKLETAKFVGMSRKFCDFI
jgi:hypothetical protein